MDGRGLFSSDSSESELSELEEEELSDVVFVDFEELADPPSPPSRTPLAPLVPQRATIQRTTPARSAPEEVARELHRQTRWKAWVVHVLQTMTPVCADAIRLVLRAAPPEFQGLLDLPGATASVFKVHLHKNVGVILTNSFQLFVVHLGTGQFWTNGETFCVIDFGTRVKSAAFHPTQPLVIINGWDSVQYHCIWYPGTWRPPRGYPGTWRPPRGYPAEDAAPSIGYQQVIPRSQIPPPRQQQQQVPSNDLNDYWSPETFGHHIAINGISACEHALLIESALGRLGHTRVTANFFRDSGPRTWAPLEFEGTPTEFTKIHAFDPERNVLLLWRQIRGAGIQYPIQHVTLAGQTRSDVWYYGAVNRAIDIVQCPETSRVLAATARHSVFVWHVDGHLIHTFRKHTNIITSLALVPGKPWVVTTSFDKSIRVWDYDACVEHATEKARVNWWTGRKKPQAIAVNSNLKMLVGYDTKQIQIGTLST